MAQHPSELGALWSEALAALRDRPWPIVFAGVLNAAVTAATISYSIAFDELDVLRGLSEEATLAIGLATPPLFTVVNLATWLVGLHVALRTLRREPVAWSAGLALVGPGLVLNALGQAFALVGLVACVVPAFVVAVGLAYGQWFLVDRGLGPLAALGASWDATRGLRRPVFGLCIATLLLVLLGALVTVGAAFPLAFSVALLMGASSHDFVAARIFTARAQSEPGAAAPLDAPAPPVPVALWVVAVLASLVAISLWDPSMVRWLYDLLRGWLPTLEEPPVKAAVAGAVVAPALAVLVVGLRIHTRHRAAALDPRGLWLDATPRDGRLVPWSQVEWFDVVGDGVRLKLRGQWSGLGPLVALEEARRPEAVALLEARSVRRRDG